MPRHHPHHHGPGHHGPGHVRIIATYDPAATPVDFAQAASYLGTALGNGDDVVINDVTILVPPEFELELVYERTPHGTLALVLRAEWSEVFGSAAARGKLVFGKPTPRAV